MDRIRRERGHASLEQNKKPVICNRRPRPRHSKPNSDRGTFQRNLNAMAETASENAKVEEGVAPNANVRGEVSMISCKHSARKLACEWRGTKGQGFMVVFIHGHNSDIKNSYIFDKLANSFGEEGSVVGIELPGHGRSEGLRGSLPNGNVLIEDLADVIVQLYGQETEAQTVDGQNANKTNRQLEKTCQILLCGHGMGGLLAVVLAEVLDRRFNPVAKKTPHHTIMGSFVLSPLIDYGSSVGHGACWHALLACCTPCFLQRSPYKHDIKSLGLSAAETEMEVKANHGDSESKMSRSQFLCSLAIIRCLKSLYWDTPNMSILMVSGQQDSLTPWKGMSKFCQARNMKILVPDDHLNERVVECNSSCVLLKNGNSHCLRDGISWENGDDVAQDCILPALKNWVGVRKRIKGRMNSIYVTGDGIDAIPGNIKMKDLTSEMEKIY